MKQIETWTHFLKGRKSEKSLSSGFPIRIGDDATNGADEMKDNVAAESISSSSSSSTEVQITVGEKLQKYEQNNLLAKPVLESNKLHNLKWLNKRFVEKNNDVTPKHQMSLIYHNTMSCNIQFYYQLAI